MTQNLKAGTSLDLSECKRCSKRIASMKKPSHTSQETFDRFSGICSECFLPEEKILLVQAMKNDMFNNVIKQSGKGKLII